MICHLQITGKHLYIKQNGQRDTPIHRKTPTVQRETSTIHRKTHTNHRKTPTIHRKTAINHRQTATVYTKIVVHCKETRRKKICHLQITGKHLYV